MADHDQDDPEPSPRGRRQSISTQTFEALSDFREVLVRMEAKVDAITADMRRYEVAHADHETRIRVLEAQLTAYVAGATATAGARKDHVGASQWVFGALLTVISLGLAVFTALNK